MSLVFLTPVGSADQIDSLSRLIEQDIRSQTSSDEWPFFTQPIDPPLVLPIPSSSKPLVLFPAQLPIPAIVLAHALPSMPAVLASEIISSSSTSTAPSLPSTPSTVTTSTPPASAVGPAGPGKIIDLSLLDSETSSTMVVGVVINYHPGSTSRSVIYLTEINLPASGVGINHLIGSQARTNRFLSTTSASGMDPSKQARRGEIPEAGYRQQRFVRKFQKALKAGDIDKASEAWMRFLHKAIGKQIDVSSPKMIQADLSASLVKAIIGIVFDAALQEAIEADFDGRRRFMVRKSGVYARSVLVDLFNRGVIQDDMWPGGVVMGALLPLQDWVCHLLVPGRIVIKCQDTIQLSLARMSSLSSDVPLHLLRYLFASEADDGAPLATKLVLQILEMPPPGPTWRSGLRRSLSVSEATRLLGMLSRWLEKYETMKQLDGVDWTSDSKRRKNHVKPSLQSVSCAVSPDRSTRSTCSLHSTLRISWTRILTSFSTSRLLSTAWWVSNEPSARSLGHTTRCVACKLRSTQRWQHICRNSGPECKARSIESSGPARPSGITRSARRTAARR